MAVSTTREIVTSLDYVTVDELRELIIDMPGDAKVRIEKNVDATYGRTEFVVRVKDTDRVREREL